MGHPLSQQFDRSVQRLLATRIAVYLMTFLIVTVAWAAHTRYRRVGFPPAGVVAAAALTAPTR